MTFINIYHNFFYFIFGCCITSWKPIDFAFLALNEMSQISQNGIKHMKNKSRIMQILGER